MLLWVCSRKMIAVTNEAAARWFPQPRRNVAEVFTFVKEALDENARALECEIAFVLTLAISVGRNNRSYSPV